MIAEAYKTLLSNFNKAFERLESDLADIRKVEMEFNPAKFRESYQKEQTLGERLDFGKQREKAAKYIFDELLSHAEREFAPAGARLTIDRHDVEEKFDYRAQDFLNLDPLAVWSYLSETYGQGKADEVAYGQAADPIARIFDLTTDKPIKTVAGQLVVEMNVWIDGFDKKWSGVNKLSHGCAQNVHELSTALACFATWADEPELARDLREFSGTFGHGSNRINSRARYPLGNQRSPAVTVITFTTRFEWRFRADIGVKLQEFVGIYATRFKAAA